MGSGNSEGAPTWGETANPPGVGPHTWQGASQRPDIAFNALRAHFRVAWSGSQSAARRRASCATGVHAASFVNGETIAVDGGFLRYGF